MITSGTGVHGVGLRNTVIFDLFEGLSLLTFGFQTFGGIWALLPQPFGVLGFLNLALSPY